jgi:hypothetical protein
MKRKVLIVTVTDSQNEKKYSECVKPYLASSENEQIATSINQLIQRHSLDRDSCTTEWEIKTEE